ASIMVMQPKVLILDEPTSQLDPIAASEFLQTIKKINREIGTTIILSEHRLEEAFPMSDRVIAMENGRLIAFGTPEHVGQILKDEKSNMFESLPTPMRVFSAIKSELPCPITVRDGRRWLENIAKVSPPNVKNIPNDVGLENLETPIIELKDVHFRYEKNEKDVVKGLSVKILESEIFAIVGGNGTGKTTSLSIMSGLLKPYRGEVLINGNDIKKLSDSEKFGGLFGVLPQNPQSLFVKNTVKLDLYEMLKNRNLQKEEQDRRFEEVCEICEIWDILESHPYDVSGGEQQRIALAKILLMRPKILFLDEPTTGMDSHFKKKLGRILRTLSETGVSVIMVSHDIEFCAEHATKCAMFFDGSLVSSDTPRHFFAGNSFYTTAANRMARNLLPTAILDTDIILAFGGDLPKPTDEDEESLKRKLLKIKQSRHNDKNNENNKDAKNNKEKVESSRKNNEKLTKRTLMALAMIVLAIPLTIYVGIYFFGDRKYYFISLLIILETLLPFAMVFEKRKPQARELVIISVLCAIAIGGRAAFFWVPQVKPVIAIVIIAGVAFGGETGFLVGAITGFVSNMFFGQGPWTPWQMFAFGIIGFLAGVLFQKGLLSRKKTPLCIFGGVATLCIYGLIMNASAVLTWQTAPKFSMFLATIVTGFPFDLIHAVSTMIFLWFISKPMLEKLDRIKVKYGLIEQDVIFAKAINPIE
ncbi:MAG: ATP-binding cassette domain-containing protein, partial [Oscillospiraceae bacterium]